MSYLSVIRDFAFFSGMARIRITILNNSLSSEPSEVFNGNYKRFVNPYEHQELFED